MKIDFLHAYEILDSRGIPTVELLLQLENKSQVTASIPAGASRGVAEAVELRDEDMAWFGGRGVLRPIFHINEFIAPLLKGKECDVLLVDQLLIELDGTASKKKLGMNALLPVSLAVARAQAKSLNLPLYRFISEIFSEEGLISLPYCLFNLINGGLHVGSGLAFQEFMIIPRSFSSIRELLSIAGTIDRNLKSLLIKHGESTAIGDEGGFAPLFSGLQGLDKERRALELLAEAVILSGYSFEQVSLAIDVAASRFFDQARSIYSLYGADYDRAGLIALYDSLAQQYPIISIEDGMHETDYKGWQMLNKKLGADLQLVGDDVFVTNTRLIEKGIEKKLANAVLIKPTQIGTFSETLAAIALAQSNDLSAIISHRSGETNDDFIVDLAVGTNAGQLKAGAPVRGERIAKYNRLLAIERDHAA